jgi:putative spermidine/putrescine transport system ATP-binding protein
VIAGFEQPDEGSVELGGKDVSKLPPYARDVNTVFQDYALFPHMTVQENIEYGLRVKKVPRAERRSAPARRSRSSGSRATAAASLRSSRRPAAAGRARARDRQPAPGAPPRRAARRARPEASPGAPGRAEADPAGARDHFVYVTHDQEEALTMSDRLACSTRAGSSRSALRRRCTSIPASEFIAGFVGVSNVLERAGRRFTVRPEKIRLLGDGESPEPGAVVGGADRERRLRRGDHALPRRSSTPAAS